MFDRTSGPFPPVVYQSFRRSASIHPGDVDFATDRERNRPGSPEKATRSCCCRADKDSRDNLSARTYLSKPCGYRAIAFRYSSENIISPLTRGRHFDHRNQTDPRTTAHVGIDDGDHSLVFGNGESSCCGASTHSLRSIRERSRNDSAMTR
jgi:hypothetical protein